MFLNWKGNHVKYDGISRNHFIWVYIKKSGQIISRNLSDLHLLPHLLRLT